MNKIKEQSEKQAILEDLRDAIQDAEQYGLVRTEDGTVITGAIVGQKGSIILTRE